MEFRIAETFTDSLARLTGDEQKAIKTTAFDLQLNPANPGMQFHKLDKARDKKFWSVRVGSDIRLIVHKSASSLLLCYVDHHDRAYDWAERRKLQVHPKTGAAQFVEIRETVQEIVVPKYIEEEQPKPKAAGKLLFAGLSEETLLGYGVPQEWLDDVHAATEDSLFALVDHLPGEAAEALLELATGGKPRILQPATAATDPFEHPDALRRFRVMANMEELARALDFPWEKWTIFLHPDQRQLIEHDYSGPARVSGSAGNCLFVRLVRQGKQNLAYATPLATFAIREVRGGRRVGGRLNKYDVTSAYCRRLHDFKIEQFGQCSELAGGWRQLVFEDRSAGPAETVAVRIDFDTWFSTLPQRKRRVAEALALGEQTALVAQRFGLSPGRISQLRAWFRAHWDRFQSGKLPGCAA